MKLLLGAVVFTILASVCGNQMPPQIDKKKLIGRWISMEDKNFMLAFTATTRTEYYGTDVVSIATYHIDKNTLIAKDKGTGDTFTYDISTLTDKTLSLIYLDRGNTLKFKKQ